MSRPVFATTVTWRVTVWRATECRRWQIQAFADHPHGNWTAALKTAREWFTHTRDDIEHGLRKIKVEPINVTTGHHRQHP